MQAALDGIADIVGAGVVVIAIERASAGTRPICAQVVDRTEVAVVAGGIIKRSSAAQARLAGIVGAGIAIVAIEGLTAQTGALAAHFAVGAPVLIVAGSSIVSRHQRTASVQWIAEGSQAELVLALRCRAIDDAVRGGLALVGEFRVVAKESPVADIVIVQRNTVSITGTVASDGSARAASRLAEIPYRAGLVIIALSLVVLEAAPPVDIADIIGAGVVVIAYHRCTLAVAVEAKLGHGARVTVVALHALLRFEDAALVGLALVQGAGVAVVAGSFVYLPIAIVIRAVAEFLVGDFGITLTQPLFSACPVTAAGTKFVGHFTGGAQTGGNRELGAGAGTRLQHAIVVAFAIYRICIEAVAPLGTEDLVGAEGRAEGAFAGIDHTGCRNSRTGLTIVIGGARQTEGRSQTDTSEEHVRAA
jgi:hypothetical protein